MNEQNAMNAKKKHVFAISDDLARRRRIPAAREARADFKRIAFDISGVSREAVLKINKSSSSNGATGATAAATAATNETASRPPNFKGGSTGRFTEFYRQKLDRLGKSIWRTGFIANANSQWDRESHKRHLFVHIFNGYSAHSESAICSDALQFRSRILRVIRTFILFYFFRWIRCCVYRVRVRSHWIWKERFSACRICCCRSTFLAIAHPFACIRLSVVLSWSWTSSSSLFDFKQPSDNDIKAYWGLTELFARRSPPISSRSSRRSTLVLGMLYKWRWMPIVE